MACKTVEILSSHFLRIKMLFIVSRNMTSWRTYLYSLPSRKIEIASWRGTNLSSQPQLVVDFGILATFISKTNSSILLKQLCAIKDVFCIKQLYFKIYCYSFCKYYRKNYLCMHVLWGKVYQGRKNSLLQLSS